MKKLNTKDIHALSKLIYQTNVMPTGHTDSFEHLSNQIIAQLQSGADFNKLCLILESELKSTYGLDPNKQTIETIANRIVKWYD